MAGIDQVAPYSVSGEGLEAATAKVVVQPAVLKWARLTSGHSEGHVAGRLKVEANLVRSWESTPTALGYTQLQQLSALYKRPLTALLLSAPPEDFAFPTDFRVDPSRFGDKEWTLSPRIYELVRRTRYALDIVDSVRADAAEKTFPTATLDRDPELVASEERRRFDVSVSLQTRWGATNSYREWRKRMQSLGVITCQYSLRETGVRGFSLIDSDSSPAIVVSSTDSYAGRTFTMFHEYAHLLLRKGGLCDPPDGLSPVSEGADHRSILQVERWCNHFAGAFLMPREAIEEVDVAFVSGTPRNESIGPIANRLGISRLALMTRLRVLNLVDETVYWAWWRLLSEMPQRPRTKPTGELRIPRAKLALGENGARLSRIVLQAYETGSITPLEASDALHLRVPQFPRLMDLLDTGAPEL